MPDGHLYSIRYCARVANLHSDILHPGRAGISKDELADKLGGMYKAQKEQISVFGLRSQYGGGKTTGFALVYDSPEAMQKFEPRYRLIRVGKATKPERAAKQQRTWIPLSWWLMFGIFGHPSHTLLFLRGTYRLLITSAGKQRKNRLKKLRGTAKVKGAKPKKEK